jgi:hypothetical protein
VVIKILSPHEFEMSAAFPLILTFSLGRRNSSCTFLPSRKSVEPLTAQNSPERCKHYTIVGFMGRSLINLSVSQPNLAFQKYLIYQSLQNRFMIRHSSLHARLEGTGEPR